MRALLALGFLAAFGFGCVQVNTRRIGHTESGKPIYRITCNQSIDNCYDEAARVCHGNFMPMGESGSSGSRALGDDSVSCAGNDCSVHRAPRVATYDGALVVRCQ